MLTEAAIRESLAALDQALATHGVRGEICLYGGAVMVLAFQARQSTRDVDAIFAPAAMIRDLAAEIGRERGWDEHWLNDGVKGFLSSRQQVADAGLNFAHLTVTMPVPEYLLAMKCMAARLETESRDLDDVKFLLCRLGIGSAGQALAIVEAYYPSRQITVKTQYFVEAAFEEMAADTPLPAGPPAPCTDESADSP